MKELKCFTSYNNYFPQSYLESSLSADAKALGVSGDKFKALKKKLENDLLSLSEEMTGLDLRVNQRRELTTLLFQTLGYYELDKALDYNPTRDLNICGKRYSIEVESAFRFKGGAQLWLISHQPELASARNQDLLTSKTDLKPEHFFDEHALASLKGAPTSLPFRDIVDAIFDGDQTNCDFIIVNSGNCMYLLERGKWQDGPQSYLALDLLALFTEINANQYYIMAEALFSPIGFPIASAENFHETLERNAYKKASEVTKALRDTVRESIEIIADEILHQHGKNSIYFWANRNLKNRDDRQKCADDIFDQTLKYIFRMLFMLFTESQDQAKGALPVQSKAYQLGYSIEKLRDLEKKPYLRAQSDQSKSTFIHETLERSFSIYFGGYSVKNDKRTNALGFAFPSLGTKLFDPASTPIFSKIKLPDSVLQLVLEKLSLAKTGRGRSAKVYRVHYASLGLNQLGAVYEGLLTLKPEILGEKVILLAKEDKDMAHRYAPYSQIEEIDDKQIAYDTNETPMYKDRGSFVLTPVGLERKFSASFYTPELLTRFLAKQAVNTLLGESPSLDRMENLKILEPAMGSGAFLNAVVDEIAPRMAKLYEAPDKAAYDFALARLSEKDNLSSDKLENIKELKPKAPIYYLSKAKNHLMRNSVYGIDLNTTAVELAKISLWLNCLHEDGNLPFLDMKLRVGNSLVGAWVNRYKDLSGNHHWFIPSSKMLEPHLDGRILGETNRPFIKDENEISRIKSIGASWDRISEDIVNGLLFTSVRENVKDLYKNHNTLKIDYQAKIRAEIDPQKKEASYSEYISKNTSYNQLRAMMDLWCSLWFWPHDQLNKIPNAKDYIGALKWLSENPLEYGHDQISQLRNSGFPFLEIAHETAQNNKFFHYDLEFSDVFESQGGFDLVLGNPPWAPIRWEESDFFEMHVPGINDLKGDSRQKHLRYAMALRDSVRLEEYISTRAKADGLSNFLKESKTYPFNDRSKANTYRYFYQRFLQSCRFK